MALFHDVASINRALQGRIAGLSDVEGDDELQDLLNRVSDYRSELLEEDHHSDMDLHDAHEESMKAGIKLGREVERGKKIYVVVAHDPPSIHTLYILGKNTKDVMEKIKPHLDKADRQIAKLKAEQESDDD
jgi:hypothetical protein